MFQFRSCVGCQLSKGFLGIPTGLSGSLASSHGPRADEFVPSKSLQIGDEDDLMMGSRTDHKVSWERVWPEVVGRSGEIGIDVFFFFAGNLT